VGEERWCCWWGLRVVDHILDGQSFLMDRVYVDLCSMGYELKALNMHNSMVVDPQTVLDFCFMGYEPLTNSSSKWQRLTIVTPKSYHLSPLILTPLLCTLAHWHLCKTSAPPLHFYHLCLHLCTTSAAFCTSAPLRLLYTSCTITSCTITSCTITSADHQHLLSTSTPQHLCTSAYHSAPQHLCACSAPPLCTSTTAPAPAPLPHLLLLLLPLPLLLFLPADES
jgi:hypothetical protein